MPSTFPVLEYHCNRFLQASPPTVRYSTTRFVLVQGSFVTSTPASISFCNTCCVHASMYFLASDDDGGSSFSTKLCNGECAADHSRILLLKSRQRRWLPSAVTVAGRYHCYSRPDVSRSSYSLPPFCTFTLICIEPIYATIHRNIYYELLTTRYRLSKREGKAWFEQVFYLALRFMYKQLSLKFTLRCQLCLAHNQSNCLLFLMVSWNSCGFFGFLVINFPKKAKYLFSAAKNVQIFGFWKMMTLRWILFFFPQLGVF